MSGAPQLLARKRGSFGERAQLRPRNLWMHRPPRPQSVPAITFSRPTRLAKARMRSATSSGCSTTSVAWLTTPPNTIGGVSICNLSPISNSIQEKTSAPGQLRRYVCKTFARFVWYPVTFRPRLRSVADASPATRPLRGMEAWAGVRCAFVLPKT